MPLSKAQSLGAFLRMQDAAPFRRQKNSHSPSAQPLPPHAIDFDAGSLRLFPRPCLPIPAPCFVLFCHTLRQ